MRWRTILTVALLIIAVAVIAIWQMGRAVTMQGKGQLTLTNLPDHYCPTSARVLVTDLNATKPNILFDSEVSIVDCQSLSMATVLGTAGEERYVFAKLPHALAFRIQADSPQGSYQFSPSLGDVNNDNIIDAVDEQQVASSLLTVDSNLLTANDVDQDKEVTVLDLSLTRINRQVGVDRPGGRTWTVE